MEENGKSKRSKISHNLEDEVELSAEEKFKLFKRKREESNGDQVVDAMFKDFIASKLRDVESDTKSKKHKSKSSRDDESDSVLKINRFLDTEISSLQPSDNNYNSTEIKSERDSEDREYRTAKSVSNSSDTKFDPNRSEHINSENYSQLWDTVVKKEAPSDVANGSKLAFGPMPPRAVASSETEEKAEVKKPFGMFKNFGIKLSATSAELIQSGAVHVKGKRLEEGEVTSDSEKSRSSETPPVEEAEENDDDDDIANLSETGSIHDSDDSSSRRKKRKKEKKRKKHKSKDREVKEESEKPSSTRKSSRDRSKSPKKSKRSRSHSREKKSKDSRRRSGSRHRSTERKESKSKSRKSRSKSRDHKSTHRKDKTKDKSRSRSRDRDRKSSHKRRSKERSRSRGRRSRSKGRRSRSRDRKSRSRGKRSRSRGKRSKSRGRKSRSRERRSRSRGRRSRSRGRKSRSRSPIRRRRSRSHSPAIKSKFGDFDAFKYSRGGRKSRSRSRSPTQRRPKDSKAVRDLRSKIDKAKLREIAIKNALSQAMVETTPLAVTLKAGGKSVQELTDYCKKIAEKEDQKRKARGYESSSEEEMSEKDSDEELNIHPFKIKEPAPIVMDIKNAKQLPIVSPAERIVQQSQLRTVFPVSSGSEHRNKESEWVPVVPGQKPNLKPGTYLAVDQPAGQGPPPPAQSDKVFDDPPPEPVDISSIVSQRLNAVRKLAENPHDVAAKAVLSAAQKQASQWAQSKNLPGAFLGSTGANVMTAQEIIGDKRRQAWLKKDVFTSAAPVTGGIGMYLLQKMGWKQGEGLGKNNEGKKEPLMLDFKVDRRGLLTEGEGKKGGSKQSVPKVITRDLSGKHPVSALGELCNKRRWGPPIYEIVHESGPAHKKDFLFKVTVNKTTYQPAVTSTTKKIAKADAATVVLQTLGLVPRTK